MNLKVVVVEDNPLLLAQYVRTLEKADIEVQSTDNSFTAIDLIDDTAPNVILLDMLLKGPNALTLLHELKSHEDLTSIPVVVISSMAEDVSLDQLRAYGVVDVLDKTSMHPRDIVRAVKRWV
ncbi:MAG TPA: response regulator [Candidatus Saccharimonadales bacterium]